MNPIKLSYYVGRNFKYSGKVIGRSFLGECKSWRAKANDLRCDRNLGICTVGGSESNDLLGSEGDGIKYLGQDYSSLNIMVEHLNLTTEDVFLDLGCGKGRVICRVGQENIRKAVGVELRDDLVEIAKDNATQLAGRQTQVEVIRGDACDYDFTDVTIVFMYEPFGWKTLKRVLANIEKSLRKNPRSVRVLFSRTERFGVVLDMCDWLTPAGAIGQTGIREWRTAKI